MNRFAIDNIEMHEAASILFPNYSGENTTAVSAYKIESGVEIDFDNNKIGYDSKSSFFYALSILSGGGSGKIIKNSSFDTLTLMLDLSRDAVNNLDSIKKMIEIMVQMGFNQLMLYTEDLFELNGYKYFGYKRGRFSGREIQEIDRYCLLFGVELVPCIQTLAHFSAYKRWKEVTPILDMADTLLVDNGDTYKFIDSLLQFVSDNFTSKKILLGMDEAYYLGRGKYLDENGYKKPVEIFLSHLDKVTKLCEKYNMQPSIWSDMFFSDSMNSQYKCENALNGSGAKVSSDLTLVYWEYSSNKVSVYENIIKEHKKLTGKIQFAGAACRHVGFAPYNTFSYLASEAGLTACKEQGIRDVILTCWTSLGGECSPFVSLPLMQYYGDMRYDCNVTVKTLNKNFSRITGGNWDDFMSLENLNNVEGNVKDFVSPCKYLFYSDVMLGLFDKHIKENKFAVFYKDLAKKYTEAARRNGQWAYLFEFAAKLSEVLEVKSELSIKIRKAYDDKNIEKLKNIASAIIPECIKLISDFKDIFEKNWMKENKIWGIEILQIRIGGLISRLEFAKKRILSYIENDILRIEELEDECLFFDGVTDGECVSLCINTWQHIVSTSIMD